MSPFLPHQHILENIVQSVWTVVVLQRQYKDEYRGAELVNNNAAACVCWMEKVGLLFSGFSLMFENKVALVLMDFHF